MIDEMSRSEGLIGPIRYMIKNRNEDFLLAGRFCLKDKDDDVFFSSILDCYEIDTPDGEKSIVIEENNRFGEFRDITVLVMSQICGYKLSYQKPAAEPGEGISIDL